MSAWIFEGESSGLICSFKHSWKIQVQTGYRCFASFPPQDPPKVPGVWLHVADFFNKTVHIKTRKNTLRYITMSHIESISSFQPFTYVPSFNLKVIYKAESLRYFTWFCRDPHWTQSKDPPSADPSEYVALQSRRSAKANCHHRNLSSFSTLTSCYPMLIQRRGIGSFAIR